MTYSNSGLLSVLEDYLRLTGTCPLTLGQEVAGDDGLVNRIRHGAALPEPMARAVLDRVISDLERTMAEVEIRAELADLTDEAAAQGVDLVNRTVLMPVPIDALPEFHRMVEAYA